MSQTPTMETLALLHPRQPYNFALTLDLFDKYTHPVLDVVYDGAYWRVIADGDNLALLCIDTCDAPQALRVRLAGTHGTVDRTALVEKARHILHIDSDPNGFYDVARSDPALWRVVEPLVGVRWLRTASVFEALMMTIIEQQIAWTSAQRAQRWLCEWGNRTVQTGGRVYYAFPSPGQLAAVDDVQELAPLKITFKRMRVMIDIARQMQSGQLDLENIVRMTAEEAYAALNAIQGIGHWTAAYAILRAIGYHNYVGHNDVALQAAVNHYFYGGTGRIPESQVIETFAPYGPYAGAAAYHTIMRWVMDRY